MQLAKLCVEMHSGLNVSTENMQTLSTDTVSQNTLVYQVTRMLEHHSLITVLFDTHVTMPTEIHTVLQRRVTIARN